MTYRNLTEAGRWSEIDKAALCKALLALRTCPDCRADLLPVALVSDVWGCPFCHETWHLPNGEEVTS